VYEDWGHSRGERGYEEEEWGGGRGGRGRGRLTANGYLVYFPLRLLLAKRDEAFSRDPELKFPDAKKIHVPFSKLDENPAECDWGGLLSGGRKGGGWKSFIR
jgi:hypothetical protein